MMNIANTLHPGSIKTESCTYQCREESIPCGASFFLKKTDARNASVHLYFHMKLEFHAAVDEVDFRFPFAEVAIAVEWRVAVEVIPTAAGEFPSRDIGHGY